MNTNTHTNMKKITNIRTLQDFSETSQRAQMIREASCKTKKILALRPGYWLHTEYSTKGRTNNEDLVVMSRKILNGAYYTTGVNCVYAPMALWYVDDEMLAKFSTEIKTIEAEAAIFNETATLLDSTKRIIIKHYTMSVDVDDEALACRMGQHVRDVLEDAKDALINKDRKAFELVMDKARNMDQMAIGEQSEIIRATIADLKQLKKRMNGALRAGEDFDPKYDFSLVDTCIAMFQPLD